MATSTSFVARAEAVVAKLLGDGFARQDDLAQLGRRGEVFAAALEATVEVEVHLVGPLRPEETLRQVVEECLALLRRRALRLDRVALVPAPPCAA
eukprot:4362365-Pyramimonas_sp.AAC.1